MNITTKLNHIDQNFIEEYLGALGIEDTKHYLKPTKTNIESWKHYPNILKACEVLKRYVENGSDIGIVVDSDADGYCSAALIYNFLKSLGHTKFHIYFHEGKQHGIKDKLEKIIATNGKNSLLIVPDAGSNDVAECQALGEATIEVICADHHMIETENNHAIVVNNQMDGVANKALSGTGVTDKLVRAYCDTYGVVYPNYTDLVAVSLVTDICDLSTMENRWYIYNGLKTLTNPFLAYLFEKCCKRRGKTPDAIGWDIGPLGNALARSDEQDSKTLFFDGLVGNLDPEDALKKMRRVKRIQDDEVKSVVNEIEPNLDVSSKVIIGFTDPSNASFTGLIANKFNGKYNKPTILLRDTGYGSWSGSLRSPVPLATKINEGGLAKAQGHEEACGIFVKQNKFDEFRAWLETLDLSETPNVEVTAEVRPEDITLDICQAVMDWNQLWGHGVEAPTFYLKLTLTQNNVYVFEKNSTTIKIDLGCVNFIKFFATKADVEAFRKYSRFEIELVVGELSVNEWEGVKTPQAIIKKYEIVPQEDVWDEDSWMKDF